MTAHTDAPTRSTSTLTPGETYLRRILQANAVFSVLAGGALALFGTDFAQWAGVPAGGLVVRLIGVAVTVFGFALVALARREPLPLDAVRAVFFADLAWVAGSVFVVVTDPFGLTVHGEIVVALVSDTVLLFAILEWIGIRRVVRGVE